MTDGGVDDELHSPREVERHWVDSLFRSETWKVYSSTDTTDAVVCVGAFDESAVFEERDAHDAERQFLLDRLRVAGEVWGDLDESQVDIDGDDGLSHEPPEVLRAAFLDVAQAFDEGGALAVLAQDVADPVARADAIVEMRRLYEIIALENAIDDEEDEDDEDDDEDDERAAPPPPPADPPKHVLALTKTAVSRTRTLCVDDSSLRTHAPQQRTAIVTRLKLRRPSTYSCPAAFLLVMGSRDRALTPDDLRDGGAIRNAALKCMPLVCRRRGCDVSSLAQLETTPVGGVLHVTEVVEGVILEIAPPNHNDGIFPIALVAFTPLKTVRAMTAHPTGAVETTLRRRRALRGVAVVLLAPEDRMLECDDDHEIPNIDMDFVGFQGYAFPPPPA